MAVCRTYPPLPKPPKCQNCSPDPSQCGEGWRAVWIKGSQVGRRASRPSQSCEAHMKAGPAELAANVKAKAADLGFTLVGVATTEPFDVDLEHTLRWLQDGMNAGMAWMTDERARRACQPDELLPGARSLVVVGAAYGGVDPDPSDA